MKNYILTQWPSGLIGPSCLIGVEAFDTTQICLQTARHSESVGTTYFSSYIGQIRCRNWHPLQSPCLRSGEVVGTHTDKMARPWLDVIIGTTKLSVFRETVGLPPDCTTAITCKVQDVPRIFGFSEKWKANIPDAMVTDWLIEKGFITEDGAK